MKVTLQCTNTLNSPDENLLLPRPLRNPTIKRQRLGGEPRIVGYDRTAHRLRDVLTVVIKGRVNVEVTFVRNHTEGSN